jgi:hypothetical protein
MIGASSCKRGLEDLSHRLPTTGGEKLGRVLWCIATAALISSVAACAVDERAFSLETAETTDAATVVENARPAPASAGIAVDPEALEFGSLTVGSSADGTVTISNPGTTELSIPILGLAGEHAADFGIGVNRCIAPLAPGAACSATIAFVPTEPGTRTASLVVQAGAGITAAVALSGVGLVPGALSGDLQRLDFGGTEVRTPSSTLSWTVTNTGGVSSGALSLTNTNDGEFSVENACTTELPPGASCTVSVRFQSDEAGARNGVLTLASENAGAASVALSASALIRLTVERVGSVVTAVSASGRGVNLDCGEVCSVLVEPEGRLLTFEVPNDPAVLMTAIEVEGLEPARLIGSARSDGPNDRQIFVISERMQTSGTVRFRFQEAHNLVFVAHTVSSSFGSAAAYDAECNRVATVAGLNVPTNDGYIAAVADANSLPQDRLRAGVQGWQRLDGVPFATTREALFGSEGSLSPVGFDHRRLVAPSQVMTGLSLEGLPSDNCDGWTGIGRVSLADTQGAGPFWRAGESSVCGNSGVICLGNHSTRPLTLTPSQGRRVWVTQGEYTPGTGTPDELCMSERPAGVLQALALVETAGRIPSQLLAEGQFVRADGLLTIGPAPSPRLYNGSRLLLPGPWLTADGSQLAGGNPRAWEGNFCADWRTPAVGVDGNTVHVFKSTTHVALEDSNRSRVARSESGVDCSASAHLLCVEM